MTTPTVYVVDDDVSVRESLQLLIGCAGWRSETFGSARDFLDYLAAPRARSPGCLVLDVGLPDLNGLELQQRLAGDRTHLAIVFITGQQDERIRPRVLAAGAVDYLSKPFSERALLDAVNAALAVGS